MTSNPEIQKLRDIFLSLRTKGDDPVRPITASAYAQKINRLCIIVTGAPYNGSVEWMLEPKFVCELLKKSNLKSKKDYLTCVVRLLRHLGKPQDLIEIYQKQMRSFKDEEDVIRKQNIATKSEQDNHLPLDEIQAKIKAYIPKDRAEMMSLTICAFYFSGGEDSLVPRNNLMDFKLVSSAKKKVNSDFNYLVMDGKTPKSVIMNRYKSQTKYGKQCFKLSDEQIDILTHYTSLFSKKPGDFLFTIERDIPFTSQQMLDLVKKSTEIVLGKPMGIDLIRKINATDYFAKSGLHTIEQDDNQARRFLHSSTQNREYVKPSFIKDSLEDE